MSAIVMHHLALPPRKYSSCYLQVCGEQTASETQDGIGAGAVLFPASPQSVSSMVRFWGCWTNMVFLKCAVAALAFPSGLARTLQICIIVQRCSGLDVVCSQEVHVLESLSQLWLCRGGGTSDMGPNVR